MTVTDTTSILYRIAGTVHIRKVPSWHHQACGDVTGTSLKVTAITLTDGIPVVEAIERTDVTFALGVQFHPEEAVRMNLDGEVAANRFMPIGEALAYFRALIIQAEKMKISR